LDESINQSLVTYLFKTKNQNKFYNVLNLVNGTINGPKESKIIFFVTSTVKNILLWYQKASCLGQGHDFQDIT
jgi:hypothetical protein